MTDILLIVLKMIAKLLVEILSPRASFKIAHCQAMQRLSACKKAIWYHFQSGGAYITHAQSFFIFRLLLY